ncbi:CCA tRNA nucleotidyltransferase [Paenibacillus harenae]|uniref:CCA tRNA nucleotidyltransferase n=1 Tax=Paenibacillus harenae TaxID=306543 RepID=UPI0027929B6C|nr:CCA tRNA nucleotidyltransferase [Paenibacillus harenae]MDQ0058155.1 tRNA nucleotidyltransferase (CCA-adding enzyme) [Paenibacillus harenae]
MKLSLPKPLEAAVPIVSRLEESGYEAVFVGGAVRDTVIGRPVKDVDIATSARPEQVMALFPKCIPTGLRHGTITIVHEGETYEVTTYRQESAYEDYRKPSGVAYITSLEGDLLRRDFTINAMALRNDGSVFDPFNGAGDIERRCIRCVGDADARFQEDALRMMRAVRFIAVYGYQPAVSTWKALRKHRELMRHIAMERVQAELDKILAGSDPRRALVWLHASGLLHKMKEPLPLTEYMRVDSTRYGLVEQLADLDCRWAAALLDSAIPSAIADESLRLLKLSNNRRLRIIGIMRMHEEALAAANNEGADWWAETVIRDGKQLAEDWLLVESAIHASAVTPIDLKILKAQLNEFPILTLKQLDMNGRVLAQRLRKPAGPWVSRCLHRLLVSVAGGKLVNEREKLLMQAELWDKEDKSDE